MSYQTNLFRNPTNHPAVERVLGEPYPSFARPRAVLASNGLEYVAKADEWYTGKRPAYLVAQEYLCGQLARALRVPVPDFSLLQYDLDGEAITCFGSQRADLAYRPFSPQLLPAIANARSIYLIAVFDVWLCNIDRNPNNIIVIREPNRKRLLAIDHSQCPLYPPEPSSDYSHLDARPVQWFVKPYLHPYLRDVTILRQAVNTARNMDDGTIDSATQSLSELHWSSHNQGLLGDFLKRRRDHLPALFRQFTHHP